VKRTNKTENFALTF